MERGEGRRRKGRREGENEGNERKAAKGRNNGKENGEYSTEKRREWKESEDTGDDDAKKGNGRVMHEKNNKKERLEEIGESEGGEQIGGEKGRRIELRKDFKDADILPLLLQVSLTLFFSPIFFFLLFTPFFLHLYGMVIVCTVTPILAIMIMIMVLMIIMTVIFFV